MRFAILLAGAIHPNSALRQSLSNCRVIAADGGIAHAQTLGLIPELWVGDFDSSKTSQWPQFQTVPCERFPREKDCSDAELAIKAALRLGATSLLIVGALGGPRTDHAFMNLLLASQFCESPITVELFDGSERVLPLKIGATEIGCPPGKTFSILKFSDLTGLSIEGARWPLDNADIALGSILTLSNETLGPLRLTLQAGRALLYFYQHPN